MKTMSKPLMPWRRVSILFLFMVVATGLLARAIDMQVLSSDFGAAMRMVVSPGQEGKGIMHMPAGQSSHPLSPYYSSGHEDWVNGKVRFKQLWPGWGVRCFGMGMAGVWIEILGMASWGDEMTRIGSRVWPGNSDIPGRPDRAHRAPAVQSEKMWRRPPRRLPC